MNKSSTVSSLVFFVLVSAQLLFPQVTITIDDMIKDNEFGNKYYTHYDNSTTTVDIGGPNSTSWDFSKLKADDQYISNVIDPVATPFRSDYPNAHFSYEIFTDDNQHNWEFYCHSQSMIHLHGLVYTSSSSPGVVTKYSYKPVKIYGFFPMTYYTSWKDSVIETLKVIDNGTEISSETHSIVTHALVDAYGQMTLPGGVIVDALRAKILEIKTGDSSSEAKLIYRWYTKDGQSVEFETDTSSLNYGKVNVIGNIKWMTISDLTDAAEKKNIPEKFELNQNYPNPFNPSTTIQYSVPENSFVQIRVYNTIGKEVAELVNERKSAGVYNVEFNAEGLTSGIYFAKMTAGNFNRIMKMTLVK